MLPIPHAPGDPVHDDADLRTDLCTGAAGRGFKVVVTLGSYLLRWDVVGLKDAPASALAQAVRDVHAGGRAVDPQLAADAWDEPDPLTDRERQVLRMAGDGLANGEMAGQLHLSEGTVRNYLSEAMGKLGASNRVAAARQARDRGWL